MNRIQMAGAVLIVAASGSGCASRSLTQNQCMAGDWQTVGLRDGRNGYAQTRLLTHQDACGKYHVVPERERYLAGWREGVGEFCRADHGYELGLNGYAQSDVCPADSREQFLDAWAQGHGLYEARSDVRRLQSALEHHHQRMSWIDARVIEIAAEQVRPDLTPDQRVALFAETKNLMDEKKRLQLDVPMLEDQLSTASHRLDEVERRS